MGFVQERPITLPRWARVGAVLVVVLLVAVVVLRVRASRPNLDPETGARSAAGVTVLAYTEEWGGDVSSVGGSGRLAVVDGCLGLSDGSLFVFPYGSRVVSRDGQVAVEVPGEGSGRASTVRPGDVIGIGGNRPGPVEDFGGHLVDHVPAACRGRAAVSGTEFSLVG